jgi:hypothetical protein
MTELNESERQQLLFSKLVAAGQAIETMEKTGYNNGLGFSFVEASHAYDKIRRELYSRGVFVMVGITSCEREGTLTTVALSVTFVDSETGTVANIPWFGSGSDKQDKGLAKAVTAGLKSLLLSTFLIPSGVEPDADSATDVVADKPVDGIPVERLMELVGLARERGVEDAKVKTKINALGAQRAAEMTPEQASKLEAWIKRQKSAGDAGE